MHVQKTSGSKLLLVFGTGILLIWMVFLIIISLYTSFNPTFENYMVYSGGPVDVSDEYAITYSWERYFLEPVSALSFLVSGLDAFDAYLIVIIGYIAFRLIFLIISRESLGKSQKYQVVMKFIRKTYNAFWKYFLLVLGIGALVLYLLYDSLGFIYVNENFMGYIQALVIFGLVFLLVKILYNTVVFLHPLAKLKIKRRKPWKARGKKSVRYWLHKVPNTIGREARYGLCGFLLFLTITLGLSTLQLPTRTIVPNNLGPDEMLIDMHAHTFHSDGWLSPEERVDWYIEQGIRAAAFSDHQQIIGAQRAREYVERNNLDFTVITSQEYTTYDIPGEVYDIHLNIFGLEEDITALEFANDVGAINPMNVSDMINYTKSNGGYVIVNHYRHWSTDDEQPYSLNDLFNWGVDGFEYTRDHGMYRYCVDKNLACVYTTDVHSNEPLFEFTKIKLPSNATLDNFTLHDIFISLKDYANVQGVEISVESDNITLSHDLREFDIIGDFLNYMLALDDGQVISWFAWSIGVYAIYVVLILWVRRMDASKLVEKIEVVPSKRGIWFKGEYWWQSRKR
ncbi:MAG: PHP domain-containing protein [Candidatus Hodarchaeota archaeon]